MPLLIAAFVIFGFVLLITVSPATIARLLRAFALLAIGLLALFLTVRGLAVLDLPLGGLVVFLLHRWSAQGFPGVARLKAFVAGRRAGASTIETTWLRVSLDQATGALDGVVLVGEFAGARLDQLNVVQLRSLIAACVTADPPSVRLLETYLDRVHPNWRETPSAPGPTASNAPVTRAEALHILGLAADADPAQIREAHRRLMMKLHPDHGGSDYLAAKINAARDVLMNG